MLLDESNSWDYLIFNFWFNYFLFASFCRWWVSYVETSSSLEPLLTEEHCSNFLFGVYIIQFILFCMKFLAFGFMIFHSYNCSCQNSRIFENLGGWGWKVFFIFSIKFDWWLRFFVLLTIIGELGRFFLGELFKEITVIMNIVEVIVVFKHIYELVTTWITRIRSSIFFTITWGYFTLFVQVHYLLYNAFWQTWWNDRVFLIEWMFQNVLSNEFGTSRNFSFWSCFEEF